MIKGLKNHLSMSPILCDFTLLSELSPWFLVPIAIEDSLECKQFSFFPVQYVSSGGNRSELWNEGLHLQSHTICTMASCNKQLFMMYR